MMGAGHGNFGGWFQSWDGAPADAQATLSDEEVLKIAKTALAEHMGPASADVEWRLLGESDNVVKYYCPGPKLGDPPRSGLSASGSVEVSRRNGAIMWLSVDMPWSTTPLPVNVTEEEAVRVTRRATGSDHPLSREPHLIQRGDTVKWIVMLGRRDGQEKGCDVDAVTGQVLSTHTAGPTYPSPEYLARRSGASAGTPTPPAPPTPSPDNGVSKASAVAMPHTSGGNTWALPVVTVAAVVLVCAGAALVVLRRRH